MRVQAAVMLAAVLMVGGGCVGHAQGGAVAGAAAKADGRTVTTPVFDVISVKPNKGGGGMTTVNIRDGAFLASNVSAKMMILDAFDLKESQLMEAPKWVSGERYDISAKIVDPDPEVLKKLTRAQRQEMMQPILTERFGLKYHRERKVLPIYELVVAKDGPKFEASKFKQGSDEKNANGMGAGSMMVRNGEMQSVGVPVEQLANALSRQLQRIVVDKTGLRGEYDFVMKWSPADGPPAGDNAPPEIFTAVQEQLGLKLVASKAEVDTFVIDQITQPAEN